MGAADHIPFRHICNRVHISECGTQAGHVQRFQWHVGAGHGL